MIVFKIDLFYNFFITKLLFKSIKLLHTFSWQLKNTFGLTAQWPSLLFPDNIIYLNFSLLHKIKGEVDLPFTRLMTSGDDSHRCRGALFVLSIFMMNYLSQLVSVLSIRLLSIMSRSLSPAVNKQMAAINPPQPIYYTIHWVLRVVNEILSLLCKLLTF